MQVLARLRRSKSSVSSFSASSIQPAIGSGVPIVEPLLPPAIISYDDPTRPDLAGNLTQVVYVNFLLIILAILVVILSIWGSHQIK
jgi:hypothetical protein